jgi:Arc/MetJ-type ribon-helix-helix transcriptional regulator
MKVITVNLPETMIDTLDLLVDYGIFPNRAETIRSLLMAGLRHYRNLTAELQSSQDIKPQKQAESKFRVTSIRIPTTLKKLIKDRAKKLGLPSQSELIRLAIINLVRELSE